jgi:NADH-quinone oxidoreductase subunit H
MSVVLVCSAATLLFLGGGALPFTDWPRGLVGSSVLGLVVGNLVTVGVFALKTFALVFVMFWIRATLPRMRIDRLMAFAWKFLVPLSIANVLISAAWLELVLRPGGGARLGPIGDRLLGWGVTGVMVVLAAWPLTALARREAVELAREGRMAELRRPGRRPAALPEAVR